MRRISAATRLDVANSREKLSAWPDFSGRRRRVKMRRSATCTCTTQRWVTEWCHYNPARDREGQTQSVSSVTASSDWCVCNFLNEQWENRAGAHVITCSVVIFVSFVHFSMWLLHLLWFAGLFCTTNLRLGGFWAIRRNIQICNNMSSPVLNVHPGNCATSCQLTPMCTRFYPNLGPVLTQ